MDMIQKLSKKSDAAFHVFLVFVAVMIAGLIGVIVSHIFCFDHAEQTWALIHLCSLAVAMFGCVGTIISIIVSLRLLNIYDKALDRRIEELNEKYAAERARRDAEHDAALAKIDAEFSE